MSRAVKITTAWLIGSGLKMGMSIEEIMNTTPGQMVDYVSCLAIANGAKEKNTMTFDELMEMK